MLIKSATRERVLHELEALGGLTDDNVLEVSKRTGVPEADVYGVATFYELVSNPDIDKRVCMGLSCQLAGSDKILDSLKKQGVASKGVSCLGQCDRAPAVLTKGYFVESTIQSAVLPDNCELPINLGGSDGKDYSALKRIQEIDHDEFLEQLTVSGLQGRGGAGFPTAIKWRAVRGQAERERYVVCNADEGEPGTFKDREVMLRRPHLLLEGLAIAADIVQTTYIYIYIRGEFKACREALENALEEGREHLSRFDFYFVNGHGAYICGEETALIEAIEGRRGMPRLKPPYPTEKGLFDKPTLMNNVETFACVPSIVLHGGAWFHGKGRTEAGSKLYCISGHVKKPGVYEMPLGINVDELVEVAGGYVGTPLAFSPGGASSGFLPMSDRKLPLDFKTLAKKGTLLGSAGVVVLNDTVDIAKAAWWQSVFFEEESCGQCAPCRIGTRLLQRAVYKYLKTGDPASLKYSEDIGWEMEEGSICGLGMVASYPIVSALRYFPQAFAKREQS
jgi:NADH:ubiquinone oxidoreductase subunit F (NADH-binding)